MAEHLYEVHLANGQVYDVRTAHHHQDHDETVWREHIVRALEQIAISVTARSIVKIIFRGKR